MLASLMPLFADLPLLPERASSQAGDIDTLFWFITGICFVMTLLIFLGVVAFAYKYRRRENAHAVQIEGSNKLELTWSILPFLVMLVMFGWGADLYFKAQSPPKDAMEVFVTGKQWMWKIQYPDGAREINELHIPADQPVKLTMASEDVIHSFSVPALGVRHDVVPGHYDSVWFTADKPGRYHLFCTEYCGNQHSKMIGWVDVMEPREYAKWASGGAGGSLAEQGQQLFQQNGCSTCHQMEQQGRCPILKGVYNKPVQLNDGRTVIADDAYLRESILDANAKIVNGFEPNVMPNFKGQLSEENVIQLIAYIKSLSPAAPASQQGRPPTTTPSAASRAASRANTANPGQASSPVKQ
ncbi:MAG TPA: cytochrome c oxidase subunit II [Bryobacteraceae bacterium]|jgi:cytochrome c oxidase subunit 2